MKGRPLAVLFVLALLMASSFAAFTAEPYLYSGESEADVSVTRLASGYDLVTIQGVKTFMLFEGEIVTEQGAIMEALKADYRATAMPSESQRADLLKILSDFNSTRNLPSLFNLPSEFACLEQTGITIYKKTGLSGTSPSPYCHSSVTCSCGAWNWMGCHYADQVPWVLTAKVLHGRSLYSMDTNLSDVWQQFHVITADNAPEVLANVVQDLKGAKEAAKFIKGTALQYPAPYGTCDASKFDPVYVDELKKVLMEEPGMNSNIIAVYPRLTCLEQCPDVTINITMLDDAIALAEQFEQNAAALGNVDVEAGEIAARTNDRQTYLTNAENRRTYGLIYANVTAQLANIHTITNVSAVRNSVINDVATLEVLSDQINASIEANNFELAKQFISQFQTRYSALRVRLDKILPTYTKAASARERLESEMLKTEYNLQPTDADAQVQLNALKALKQELDLRFVGAQSLNEFTVLELNYTSLGDRAQGLNDGLESLHSSQVGTIVTGVTQSAMGSSLSIWNGLSPMTPAQQQENERLLPMLLVGAADVVIMLLTLAVFVFFAFISKRIVWRKSVAMTWTVIFLVFFALLAAASFGAYTLVQRQAEAPTSFGQFSASLDAAPESAITYDVTGLGQSQIIALQACRDKLTAKLKAGNETVKNYVFSGSSCRVGTVSKTKQQCEDELAGMPQFKLQYGTENSVKFYTFYDTKAVMQGDLNYLTACNLAKVI